MLGQVNGQSVSLVQIANGFLEAVRMAFQHVIAAHAQLCQLVAGKSEGRHQGPKVFEAHSSLIIQSQKCGAAQTVSPEKLANHERVELPVRDSRRQCVPYPPAIVSLKPGPVFRKTNLNRTERACRLPDQLANPVMSISHVADDPAISA